MRRVFGVWGAFCIFEMKYLREIAPFIMITSVCGSVETNTDTLAESSVIKAFFNDENCVPDYRNQTWNACSLYCSYGSLQSPIDIVTDNMGSYSTKESHKGVPDFTIYDSEKLQTSSGRNS